MISKTIQGVRISYCTFLLIFPFQIWTSPSPSSPKFAFDSSPSQNLSPLRVKSLTIFSATRNAVFDEFFAGNISKTSSFNTISLTNFTKVSVNFLKMVTTRSMSYLYGRKCPWRHIYRFKLPTSKQKFSCDFLHKTETRNIGKISFLLMKLHEIY